MAVHTTMRPTGYHSVAAGLDWLGGASSAREPIHHAGSPMLSRNASATDPVVARARPAVAISAPVRPARWVQPTAASMIGSCAKLASTKESGDPDAIDANRSAEAAPAPRPMRTICIIVSCPAL